MAFPTGYSKYQNVTVDNTKVSGSTNHSNFPVFIDLQDLIKVGNDLFDTCRSDGGDIRVTLSDGTTELSREIVSIDTTAKTGQVHVKIPTLNVSSDTVLRVWYNGVDAEPDFNSTYGRNAVWSDYEAVYHMNNDPSGTSPQLLDSTGNGYSGTSTGSMTSDDVVEGKIGEAIEFDGENDGFSIPYTLGGALSGESELSISAWLGVTSTSNGPAVINLYYSSISTKAQMRWLTDGTFRIGARSTSGESMQAVIISNPVTDSNEHMVCGTFSLTNDTIKAYKDGVLDTNQSVYFSSATFSTGSSIDGGIGWLPHTSGGFFDNLISELRVCFNELGVDWIATEYNNQNSPNTFYSVSDEQSSTTNTTALQDMSVDIQAFYSAVEDAGLDVSACYQEFNSCHVDIQTLGEIRRDNMLDISVGLLSITNMPFSVVLAKEINMNVVMDIFLSDGTVTRNMAMDINVGDGNKRQDFGMDIMAVTSMPEFKYVYAMHLNSIIKELA